MVGFNANLTYLHLALVEALNTLTNFGGTLAFMPILGAFAADSFAGRFWTIIAGSMVYQVGMIGVVVSGILPSLQTFPKCVDKPMIHTTQVTAACLLQKEDKETDLCEAVTDCGLPY